MGLVYLDPPFNSNAHCNILFKSLAGAQSDAQIEAFEDMWHWNDHAEDAFDQVARMQAAFPGIQFAVEGTTEDSHRPKTSPCAINISSSGGAVPMVGAMPSGDNIGVTMIRDLHSAMERAKAAIGVFICKGLPSGPMERGAAAVGRFHSEVIGKTYPACRSSPLLNGFRASGRTSFMRTRPPPSRARRRRRSHRTACFSDACPSAVNPVYTAAMNGPVHTRTFKSGNSVALRLPKGFAIPAGTEVELEKSGDTVTIRMARDPEDARRQMRKAWEDMAAIGAPDGGVQPRDPFDFPDREGLF